MADVTKVILSRDELELVTDTGWHFRKQEILKKIELMLAGMPVEIDALFSGVLKDPGFPGLVSHSPKISRGDNYKGLPYMILDHPRVFEKENFFALRTMFWWGKQLSVTLHLSGEYNEVFSKRIINKLPGATGLWVATTGEEWDHDINGGGYAKLMNAGQLEGRRFNKLAAVHDITQLNEAPRFFRESYQKIAGLLY